MHYYVPYFPFGYRKEVTEWQRRQLPVEATLELIGGKYKL